MSVPIPPAVSIADHDDTLRGEFLRAMRYTAASVTVVTTDGPAGRGGVTVSAFSSLSADPPSVLVCIHRDSPVLPLIQANQRLCINLLAADQSHVADSFAGRIAQWRQNRFACAQWEQPQHCAPQLQGALANLQCQLQQDLAFGSHHILIAEVLQAHSSESEGLLYADRTYRQLGLSAPLQLELYK